MCAKSHVQSVIPNLRNCLFGLELMIKKGPLILVCLDGVPGFGIYANIVPSLEPGCCRSCAPLFQPEVSNIAQASNEETQVSEETDDDDISYTNNLLIVRVVQRLLPLLINTEYLLQPNLLHTMPPIDQIESTLLEITQEIQQHKADELTAVLGTEKLPLSPTTKYNTNFCPTMRRFGIPLDDARIQQALLTDLHQWNKKQNGTTTLHTNLGDNKMSSFVLIPSSKSFSG